MKIAIFSDCYLDLTGGIVTTINADKKELEARGHTVYIFSSAYPRDEKEKQQLAKEHIFPVKSCRVFGRGLTPIARRPKIIERQLEKEHKELKSFDVFYIHYEAGCSIAGIRLAKKYHIPIAQVMHGREDMGEKNLIPFGLRTVTATLLNWFHSWYLPHTIKVKKDHYLADTLAKAKMWTLMVNHANCVDLVITPSEHFLKKLQHYGVTKPIVSLSHGLDDKLFNQKPSIRTLSPGETLEMIWHSRLSGEKRTMPFLEAINLIKNQNYHLSVYGGGPDSKKAKRYASRCHLNVTFHGVQNFDVISKAIQKSHLDVLVSYNYDTFGMTLAEAEVFGIPVFIADPDLTEIAPKGGYILCKNPSPSSMADALQDILDHPEKISVMSKRMIESPNKKRISQKIKKLESIFQELVENSQK